MYAVIETGGKQYRVEPGMKVKVDKLPGNAGDALTFDKVLMVNGEAGIKLGRPYLNGTSVTAKVVDQDRDKKIVIFHKRRRKMYQKKNGHRQYVTVVQIDAIQA
jgi:large subunit ribosomal protein L21